MSGNIQAVERPYLGHKIPITLILVMTAGTFLNLTNQVVIKSVQTIVVY